MYRNMFKSEMRNRMSINAEASLDTLPTIDTLLANKPDPEMLALKRLVLWRSPLRTIKYAVFEMLLLLIEFGVKLWDRRLLGGLMIAITIYYMPGPHAYYMELCRQNFGFVVYWVSLGLVSSVGFGTGLHTFLLYLGPHIASVTLAAYECQTLAFPTPPYPEEKLCPEEPYLRNKPNLWYIMSKVHFETLLWGVGTAFGELPPYFLARAARMSGTCVEEQQELDQLARHTGVLSIFNRCKLMVERVVLRAGFFGILLCASVPNPLFDLAGVACGHFLVPFWKFFMATLIGKAFIKATIQQSFVIVAFSDDLVNVLIDAIAQLPWVGPNCKAGIQDMLKSTRKRMHGKYHDESSDDFGLFSLIFELIAVIIVIYFIISLINALAQEYCKRAIEREKQLQMLKFANKKMEILKNLQAAAEDTEDEI